MRALFGLTGLYHALRCDRGFDLYSAQEGGSQYELHREEHGTDANGEPTVVVESTGIFKTIEKASAHMGNELTPKGLLL